MFVCFITETESELKHLLVIQQKIRLDILYIYFNGIESEASHLSTDGVCIKLLNVSFLPVPIVLVPRFLFPSPLLLKTHKPTYLAVHFPECNVICSDHIKPDIRAEPRALP